MYKESTRCVVCGALWGMLVRSADSSYFGVVMTQDKTARRPRIAVIGSGSCGPLIRTLAVQLGEALAQEGWDVVCGGMGGIMAGVCEGASKGGAHTIGILPVADREAANPYVQTAIATPMGQLRNGLVVLNGDVVLAMEGGAGTLSEIGHAMKAGLPVVAMGKWAHLPTVLPAADAEEAVILIHKCLELIEERKANGGCETPA